MLICIIYIPALHDGKYMSSDACTEIASDLHAGKEERYESVFHKA